MSWQQYVDTSLVGSGNLDRAALFNSEGTSCWATSAGFTVAPQEVQEVVAAFADKSDIKSIQSKGVHIGGEKFVVMKADDRSIYGAKGKTGVVIVKTVQAIVIAHYPDGVQPGNAANTVEQLADYLIGVGY